MAGVCRNWCIGRNFGLAAANLAKTVFYYNLGKLAFDIVHQGAIKPALHVMIARPVLQNNIYRMRVTP